MVKTVVLNVKRVDKNAEKTRICVKQPSRFALSVAWQAALPWNSEAIIVTLSALISRKIVSLVLVLYR